MLHVIWAIKQRYVYQLFIYKFILLLYSFVLEETWWLLKWDGANGVASACTFDWKEVKLVLKEPIKNWYFFFFLNASSTESGKLWDFFFIENCQYN